MSKTIKEVLSEFARYCTIQGTPFGTMPNDDEKMSEALATIEQLVLERVIGSSPSKMYTDNWKYDRRVADVKAKQRQALKQLVAKTNKEEI